MKTTDMILIRPLMTEKIMAFKESDGKYGFQVSLDANKIEIKRAVEHKFEVEVKSVSTINVKGKQKRMNSQKGVTKGKRSDWKKAIVTLVEGHSIDIFAPKQ